MNSKKTVFNVVAILVFFCMHIRLCVQLHVATHISFIWPDVYLCVFVLCVCVCIIYIYIYVYIYDMHTYTWI